MDIANQDTQYHLRKQVFALTGKVRIYTSQDQMILYCEQKMFKLKEDIRVYADESKSRELLNIQARQIIDFSAYYDVIDSQYTIKVGGLRRKGFRSMLRDEWEIFDPQDKLLGVLVEDSFSRALLRRMLLGNLLPQNYDLLIDGERAADYKQKFNPFRYELDFVFEPGGNQKLDRRLGIAAAILLAIIEGHQEK